MVGLKHPLKYSGFKVREWVTFSSMETHNILLNKIIDGIVNKCMT